MKQLLLALASGLLALFPSLAHADDTQVVVNTTARIGIVVPARWYVTGHQDGIQTIENADGSVLFYLGSLSRPEVADQDLQTQATGIVDGYGFVRDRIFQADCFDNEAYNGLDLCVVTGQELDDDGSPQYAVMVASNPNAAVHGGLVGVVQQRASDQDKADANRVLISLGAVVN